jgi:hypothetical protein
MKEYELDKKSFFLAVMEELHRLLSDDPRAENLRKILDKIDPEIKFQKHLGFLPEDTKWIENLPGFGKMVKNLIKISPLASIRIEPNYKESLVIFDGRKSEWSIIEFRELLQGSRPDNPSAPPPGVVPPKERTGLAAAVVGGISIERVATDFGITERHVNQIVKEELELEKDKKRRREVAEKFFRFERLLEMS